MDNDIGANIGEMLAVAMASGGQTLTNAALRYTNMTDACCIAGVKFQSAMGARYSELIDWFARESFRLCQDGGERMEELRYSLVGELLVRMLEGVDAEQIRGYLRDAMAKHRVRGSKSYGNSRYVPYDDRFGFDVQSRYLVNNWGRDGDDDTGYDWWSRRTG